MKQWWIVCLWADLAAAPSSSKRILSAAASAALMFRCNHKQSLRNVPGNQDVVGIAPCTYAAEDHPRSSLAEHPSGLVTQAATASSDEGHLDAQAISQSGRPWKSRCGGDCLVTTLEWSWRPPTTSSAVRLLPLPKPRILDVKFEICARTK